MYADVCYLLKIEVDKLNLTISQGMLSSEDNMYLDQTIKS